MGQANTAVQADFREGNVLNLPFAVESFDFVFCNGVIHHSASIARGPAGTGARAQARGRGVSVSVCGGRHLLEHPPRLCARCSATFRSRTRKPVLQMMGMPSNRFIFCDTWYVPVETHTTTDELARDARRRRVSTYRKVPGQKRRSISTARSTAGRIPGAREMWGDGEHRYLLRRVENLTMTHRDHRLRHGQPPIGRERISVADARRRDGSRAASIARCATDCPSWRRRIRRWHGAARVGRMDFRRWKKRSVRRRKPFLGLCVGMQVLATAGTEHGSHRRPELDSGGRATGSPAARACGCRTSAGTTST